MMKGAILMPERRERVVLDKTNQHILQMLVNNSRTPLSEMARALRLSKPAVLQRIRAMEDKGIILQYIAFFNLIRAGYSPYIVLIETDKENEKQYADTLAKCDMTTSVEILASKYNLLWMVYTKDKAKLSELIAEQDMKIKDLRILPVMDHFFNNYELFAENEKKKIKKHNKENVKLDKTDATILNILKTNSRESLVNIAIKCNMTAEAVKHRIKRLMQKGIILSFFTNFNIFKLGFQPYLLLIKTNRNKQQQILQFIRNHKNTNGQYVLDNEFDLACIIVIKDIAELREFIEQLHHLFKDSILDYETHLMIDQIQCDFFPEWIKKEIEK